MRALAAAWRFLRGLAHVLRGLGTILLRFPRMQPLERERTVSAWARHMLRIAGVEVEVTGTPAAAGPVLIAANHISWLDILVLHASRYCRFVAKSELRHWPLIGTLATGAGTLYIERESRRDALRVVHRMAERLRAGDVLAIFPEGTTSDGTALLPFHGNLLQAAISADAPIQPVAIRFLEKATRVPSTAPCYIGDETLVGSIWRTLTAPPLVAAVHFGTPQRAGGRDRREWAGDLRESVEQLRSNG